MEQDYDRIRDKELTKHLDQKYSDDLYDSADTLNAMRDEEILSYLEGLKDEPALDTLLAVQDNFGLTSDEVSAYVRMWIDRQT